jgi:ADP-ribose pyrophosphatase YjhB (NUDIX family)
VFKKNHAILEVSQLILLQKPTGEILMLEDLAGSWGLPGGRLNNNEAWSDGLHREVREETGIVNFTFSKTLTVFQRKSRSGGLPVYGVIFAGVTNEDLVVISSEHRSYCWFVNLDDCADKKFYPREVEAVVRAALIR